MFNLFTAADRYCQTLDWKKLTLFKTCCIFFGIAMGALLPEKHKKTAFLASMVIFLVTYIPLMVSFIGSCLKEDEEMYY